ncbi:hypothetical protein QJQ45_007990 [Haematococcus lacustris]|nr:hypothetical protein QJQ45_007990 [Haematococcus lacustris]
MIARIVQDSLLAPQRTQQDVARAQQQLIGGAAHCYDRSHVAMVAAATGRPVDELYCRLGYLNGYFFPQGWGDLRVVNLEEDLKLLSTWPPPGIKVGWKLMDRGNRDGTAFKLYEGTFKTPCTGRVYDALPPESRTARVQWLLPANAAPGTSFGSSFRLNNPDPRPAHATKHRMPDAASAAGRTPGLAAAVHLAGTGDQTFGRRLRLGLPLLNQGVTTMVHESPYYGARRPPQQRGSKLLRVSDLLTLGWATIFESLNLLHFLELEGFHEGGLSMVGLSMGGVHASMTAALYPGDVACVPLLAPRSAAVAYCDGAMGGIMDWDALLRRADERDNDVSQVVSSAAQAVSVMRAASYALAELECAMALQSTSISSTTASSSSSSSSSSAGRPCEEQARSIEAAPQQLPPRHSQGAFATTSTQSGHGTGKELQNQRKLMSRLQAGLSRLLPLSVGDATMERRETLRALKRVLETFTDITRFPVPRRPDASILVAATDDAYVSVQSVRELHHYWPGSELRLVSGGHVTAFLLHQNTFRTAILDSLVRLKQQHSSPDPLLSQETPQPPDSHPGHQASHWPLKEAKERATRLT